MDILFTLSGMILASLSILVLLALWALMIIGVATFVKALRIWIRRK